MLYWRAALDGCTDLPDAAPEKIESQVGLGAALLALASSQGGNQKMRDEASELMRTAIESKQRAEGKSPEEVEECVQTVMSQIAKLK